MEFRRLRCFLCVEELHFARAAEKLLLSISCASLSIEMIAGNRFETCPTRVSGKPPLQMKFRSGIRHEGNMFIFC